MPNKIRLSLLPSVKDGERWKQPLLAIVTDENREPLEGVKVDFHRGGNEDTGSAETDDNGRATFEFINVPAGVHAFDAQESGTGICTNQQRQKFEEDKKSPKAEPLLSCRQVGWYTDEAKVIRFALTQDGKPLKKVKIRLTNQDSTRAVIEIETEDNGEVCWEVPPFEGRTRIYCVEVDIEGFPSRELRITQKKREA